MKKFYKTLIGIIAVLLLWQVADMIKVFNPIYFASPVEVFSELLKMLKSSSIYFDILSTLYRALISIIIALLVGTPIGILLGYYSRIYQFISEIVDFLRSIPPIVIYPLLLIVIGPGDVSRIGTAVFGSIVVIMLIIANGLFQQDKVRQNFFKSRGASTFQILREIVWFEALPYVMIALRTAISLSIIIIVVTEMLVGSRYGLGTRVQNVQITSNIPDLFATIIIIGLIGILLNKLILKLDKKFVFWKLN